MANAVRVVLQDEVDQLGVSGDVVKVKPGYARNYLFPRGIAVPATEANLARVDDLKKKAAQKADQRLIDAREFAKRLEVDAVKLERAMGGEGKMYGSVTAKDIEEAFAGLGLEIDRRKLELPEPIKSLGLSEVTLRVHTEVTATLRVEVVKKSS